MSAFLNKITQTSLKFVSFLALSGFLFVSCSVKEDLDDVTSELEPSPALSGIPAIKPPLSPCGGSFSTTLVDDLGTAYADVQIMNDDSYVYMMISTYGTWVLTDFFLEVGKHATVPVDPANDMLIEAFTYNDRAVDRFNSYTFVFDVSAIGTCPDLIVSSTVQMVSFTGTTFNPKKVWLNGIDHLNGKYINYCLNACPAKYAGPTSSTL